MVAVAWLSYADRLYQLPLGVVGIAIGVVLLPDLSRKLRGNDITGSTNSLNRAAEFSLLLTLPAAVALIVIPLPLVAVLFWARRVYLSRCQRHRMGRRHLRRWLACLCACQSGCADIFCP